MKAKSTITRAFDKERRIITHVDLASLVGGFATRGIEARSNTPAVVVINSGVDGISWALGGHPEEAGAGEDLEELRVTSNAPSQFSIGSTWACAPSDRCCLELCELHDWVRVKRQYQLRLCSQAPISIPSCQILQRNF